MLNNEKSALSQPLFPPRVFPPPTTDQCDVDLLLIVMHNYFKIKHENPQWEVKFPVYSSTCCCRSAAFVPKRVFTQCRFGFHFEMH